MQSIRATLAIATLAAVIAAAALAFFVGPALSDVQLTLLTMLLTALIGKLNTAFAYFFDGLPEGAGKPPPPAAAPAANPTQPAQGNPP